VLESVHNERLERDTFQDLIIVKVKVLQGIKALNLAEQNEGTQVILTQHKLLELGELFKFHQVSVVDD